LHKISNDKFLSKYKFFDDKNLTIPLFQKLISNTDDRFYDVVFENLNIVLEIQENSSSHYLNPNDLLKEALVKLRSKRIMYFKMAEFELENFKYLRKFWKDNLRPAINESLLNYSPIIRQDYCIWMFKNSICREYLNNQAEIDKLLIETQNSYYTSEQIKKFNLEINAKQKMIKLLEPIIKADDASLIGKLFKWIEQKSDINKFNIDLDDACNNIQLPIPKNADINTIELELINKCYNYSISDDKIYINWKTLVEMVLDSEKITPDKKRQISKYLLSVQDIYEDIIKKIQNHLNECLKSNLA
jgi:hypothetical protein